MWSTAFDLALRQRNKRQKSVWKTAWKWRKEKARLQIATYKNSSFSFHAFIAFIYLWEVSKLKISVHENELCSRIVHKLLATNFTIWPNSNSQKNYQANSKTINRINENCLSVQVLPSSKLFSLIFFNTRVFNLGPCKLPSHFIQSGLEWVP